MHDAIIIGGSFAGLSAAMYLARGLHDVVVLDSGTPRNRFSPQSHGFFGQDGSVPAEMLASARAQLRRYDTVRLVTDEAIGATGLKDGFTVTLASGEVIGGRRLVLASGVRDVLPPVHGLAERWGRSVLHCPYCHGYEYAGRRLGVLYADAGSVHHSRLIANWGATTLFTNGVLLTDADFGTLAGAGIQVIAEPIVALRGADDGSLTHVETAAGQGVALDALYVAPRIELRGSIADALGCAVRDVPGGRILVVDDRMMTSIDGVYAGGDAASMPSMVARAVSDGSLAGAMVSQSLIFDA
jgi:thioredoxin reductase